MRFPAYLRPFFVVKKIRARVENILVINFERERFVTNFIGRARELTNAGGLRWRKNVELHNAQR